MWAIFLISVIAIFFIVIAAAWIVNKLLISMKRDNHKYELEISNDFEHKNNNTKGEEEK
jgi:flagellar biogenesis protein FliO